VIGENRFTRRDKNFPRTRNHDGTGASVHAAGSCVKSPGLRSLGGRSSTARVLVRVLGVLVASPRVDQAFLPRSRYRGDV
jgi:hypothetical protein